jgi:rSAM/selenodomain-associated transferase 1
VGKDTLVCVFAKPPLPGKVKTRLARAIGDEEAARLARAFLADVWALVSRLGWARSVLASTSGHVEDFGLGEKIEVWLQGEGDLGARIERIVRRGLGAADRVLAIGADSPGLPEAILNQARAMLASHDAVIGPALDGGFYLLGLRRCPIGLLANIRWSAATTGALVAARLHHYGMQLGVLPRWFDVDDVGDLARLRRWIQVGAIHAPATQRALESLALEGILCA